jgi:transposase
MVKKGELTDEAWAQIAPLLPENGRRGGRWRDHREVVNGILWKLRTGAPWRDLPERYGPWQTCYDRFSRWRREGTWDRLLADAQSKSDAVGEDPAFPTTFSWAQVLCKKIVHIAHAPNFTGWQHAYA